MTVGFHSPLPPAHTGVADYAAVLLRGLQMLGDVRVGATDADVSLYHLGNNALHRDAYKLALERPGVAVLHDAVLHHFLLGQLSERSYIDEFTYNYGAWSRGLAEELWRARSRSATDPRFFEHPLLKRIAEASRAVILHNWAAAAIVRRHAPAAHVIVIPHLFEPPPVLPDVTDSMRLRQSWGIQGQCLFGVMGHLRESKRLPGILRAFARLRDEGENAALLVAGEFASTDLERALAPDIRGPGIVRIAYTPEPEFWRMAAAIDVCINLRYPAAGESSGIATRLMGIGKPVIVSTGEENSAFPDDACVRVDPGPAETGMLSALMRWLVRSPQSRREIGRRAAAHIAEHHALEIVARRYWDVLLSCRAAQGILLEKPAAR